MKTVGQFLKEARLKKSYSKAHLEGRTKIKKEFIEAIENENWEKLPEYPVVRGFVKSISDALNASSDSVLAILRRDYPPQKLSLTPLPDVGDKFVWTPKLTFLAGIAGVLITILGYLILQYVNFLSPPKLDVASPNESEVITKTLLEVSGSTDPGATVKINNQLTLVADTGNFTAQIEVSEETKKVEVLSRSRSGKETIVVRNIQVQFKD